MTQNWNPILDAPALELTELLRGQYYMQYIPGIPVPFTHELVRQRCLENCDSFTL